MTVIRPNSISGVTSITAQGDTISLYKSDGTTVGALNVNVNASSGITTIANLQGTNINVTGVTTTATLKVTGIGTFGTSVGVATASPKSALDLSLKTDAIALPQGTTAQRPSGNSPYLRWNTTNSALEFYNGTAWVEIISDYFPTGSTILG